MRGSIILLSYAKGSRGLLITPAHPTPPLVRRFYPPPPSYSPVIICQGEQRTINHPSPAPPPCEGFYYTVIICQGEQRTINHPSPPPPLVRGSTILLSYAKGSRGLLITPAHPTYEGFYYTVIICQGEQRTINHPSPPHCQLHPPINEGFYYTVIICQGEQRTINQPSPPPLMRGSTLPLSYGKGSRGLLITPAHPTYEGFYYIVIIFQGEQRTINHPSSPHL